jgi:O-antigen/teichoic acid export membrane protein
MAFLSLLLFLASFLDLSLEIIIYINIISNILATLCVIIVYLRVVQATESKSKLLVLPVYYRDVYKISINSMGANLLTQARLGVEPIVVASIFGLNGAGVVGAARRLSTVANMIANTLGAVVAPYTVRFKGQSQDLRKLYLYSSAASVFVCVASCLLLIFAGELSFTKLFGTEYSSAYLLTIVMLAVLSGRYVFGFPNISLLYRGFPEIVFKGNLVFFIITLVAIFFLSFSNSLLMLIITIGIVDALKFAWLWFSAIRFTGERTDCIPVRFSSRWL